MKHRRDWREYDKQCRAPFTDAGGNCTLPKHPRYVDAGYLEQLAELTQKVPAGHRQGFIRLHRKIFGIKILRTAHEE